LKVADFGLARSIAALENDSEANPVLTDYVATRWYRAPEILLGSTKYTKGVDNWSIGCILGELLGGKPMFPGTSTMNQLDRIIEITGRPSPDDIDAIKSPFAATMLESLPPSSPKSLSDMFPSASADALDVLRLLLQFNPNKRMTCEKALEHGYVAQFHNEKEEPSCDKEIKIAIDDDHKFSIADYRTHLYNDIVTKRKEKRRSKKLKEGTKGSSSRSSSGERSSSGSSGSSGSSKAKTKSKDGSKKHSSSSSSSKDGNKKHSSSTGSLTGSATKDKKTKPKESTTS